MNSTDSDVPVLVLTAAFLFSFSLIFVISKIGQQ